MDSSLCTPTWHIVFVGRIFPCRLVGLNSVGLTLLHWSRFWAWFQSELSFVTTSSSCAIKVGGYMIHQADFYVSYYWRYMDIVVIMFLLRIAWWNVQSVSRRFFQFLILWRFFKSYTSGRCQWLRSNTANYLIIVYWVHFAACNSGETIFCIHFYEGASTNLHGNPLLQGGVFTKYNMIFLVKNSTFTCEQWSFHPSWLGYIGDEKLPSYIAIFS